MPAPAPDDLASRIASLETTRIALVTELETTRRELWKERALRRFPSIESAVDLIPHVTDEASYQEFAATLARFATSPSTTANSPRGIRGGSSQEAAPPLGGLQPGRPRQKPGRP